ncbi:MAB_1171c family putative transporter [Streptomyces sp. NPDC029003]|uniref:MAB_1171c family putative transporter n=1 Tax=Streptomyces sp. NPDC029003 TaxID=3155125 RepID=UPI0033D198C2
MFGKGPGLRSAPRQDRVMWLMWTIWAVAFTIGVPAVRRVIDAAVGLPSFTNLPVHMLSLCAMGALFEFIREATGTRSHRRVALRWVLLGLAEAGLIVAFFASPLPDGETDLVTVTGSPMITVYWTIFLGYILYGVTSAIGLCWRYGRHAAPGPVRTSMQLLGLASFLGLVYVVHRLAQLVAAFAGRGLSSPSAVVVTTQVLLACTLLLLVASVSWPFLAESVTRVRLLRQVKAIRPLWQLLTESTPEVVLPLPEGLGRDVEMVRYRYVIEIRDSALALSCHVSQTQHEAVQHALAESEPSGVEREATAEAAVLLYSAQAERAGEPPRFPERAMVRDCGDIDADAEWLRKVAAAVRSSATAMVVDLLRERADAAEFAAPDAAS